MDRKTNQQRQTFRVQFMRSDGKTPKGLLYVVPQNGEEEEMLKLAFQNGVNQADKVDKMVETVIM